MAPRKGNTNALGHRHTAETLASMRAAQSGSGNARWQGGRSSGRAKRLWRHRMTEDEYDAQVIAQGGMCVICGDEPEYELYVDHDHETGSRRSLLCRDCNSGLGFFRDDPAVVERALEYLQNG